MDLKHTTTSLPAADSPDTDTDNPLNYHQIQLFSSFPVGKSNHHHHNHHLQQLPTVVAYKECLKNHAATIGSHALDGCGEFMPSLTCTPHEPTSLKCAACGCHRNFHRREPTNDMYAYAPHMLLPFNASVDQSQLVATPGTPAAAKLDSLHGRKRFRTKFSQNQKEKMYFFAEKIGWKMQRCDDKMVADFCNEIGIKRGVFKVWMHNNKNTFGKKEKETASVDNSPGVIGTTGVSNNRSSDDIYNNGRVIKDESHEENEEVLNVDGRDNSNGSYQEHGDGGCGGAVHLHASNNGSSSSC